MSCRHHSVLGVLWVLISRCRSAVCGCVQTGIAALGFSAGLSAAIGYIIGIGGIPPPVSILANLLQIVPVVALAPLLNIWFGYGIAGVAASKTIVVSFLSLLM